MKELVKGRKIQQLSLIIFDYRRVEELWVIYILFSTFFSVSPILFLFYKEGLSL